MKHSYVPLVTYRGWDKYEKKWIYGHLYNDLDNEPCIIPNDLKYSHDLLLGNVVHVVEPDSLGIYIGEDDCEGTPIFCAVNDAKFGSDIVENIVSGSTKTIAYSNLLIDSPEFENVVSMVGFGIDAPNFDELKIVSNQYKDHLKENE